MGADGSSGADEPDGARDAVHSADPEYSVWEQETDPEGSLTVQERLEPHETALIEVEQIL